MSINRSWTSLMIPYWYLEDQANFDFSQILLGEIEESGQDTIFTAHLYLKSSFVKYELKDSLYFILFYFSSVYYRDNRLLKIF